MANFEQLKATVANVIKTNGEENITGAIMQDVLLTIINSIAGGYMFGGVARHSGNVGNPDYNVFYLAGSGAYTGYGGAITIPDGCYGVFRYDGTWSQEVVDIGVHLTGDVATGEQNGVTGGKIKQALDDLEDNINMAINELASAIRRTFESLLVSDVTAVADKLVKITEGIRITAGGQIVNISTFDILAATAEKAGLMSAADKQKLDAFVTNIRSLRIQDTTAQADQGTEITNTLKWTIGGITEAITAFTLYAATTSKAGLMSAADKTALDTLPLLINAGYLYSGIATPSTVPSSTSAKIFYIAIEGGTYTNFGNLNVTQGINIIYKSGNAWSVTQAVGIDDEPIAGSDNFVKSGGIYPLTEIALVCYNGDGLMDEQYNCSKDSTMIGPAIIDEVSIDCYNCSGGEVDSKYNVSYGTSITNVSLYVVREPDVIDDSYLKFFSEETVLAESTGTLTGFPVACLHNDTIYVFFNYKTQHIPPIGVEDDYVYYMYSEDGGETWSEIEEIEFPASTEDTIYDGERVYFNYRYLQPVSHNGEIVALGYIVPSSSTKTLPYRPFFCRLIVQDDGTLDKTDFKLMPEVAQDGSSVTDSDEPVFSGGSNVVAGNMIVLNNTLYWCYYTSLRNVVLCRWEIGSEDPAANNITICKTIGDNNDTYDYSEVGMFYSRGYINLSIRNERGRNCNFSYDMATGNCQKVCTTERRCFGPVICKAADYPAIMVGRQYNFQNGARSRMDNLVILDDFNRPIVENIGFVGHFMGTDSMYCSVVDYEGKLYIFYYYGTTDSAVHEDSHYTLAYKTIEKKYIDTLF